MYEVDVNKMAYTAKDPRPPPTGFSVPKRNKALKVWNKKKRRKKKSPSEDPRLGYTIFGEV